MGTGELVDAASLEWEEELRDVLLQKRLKPFFILLGFVFVETDTVSVHFISKFHDFLAFLFNTLSEFISVFQSLLHPFSKIFQILAFEHFTCRDSLPSGFSAYVNVARGYSDIAGDTISK